MKRTALKRSRMSRTNPEADPEHRAATTLARQSECLVCGKVGTCVPAHFPKHRGMGGRQDFWGRGKWVPLCGEPGGCHDLVDRRLGVSAAVEARRQAALELLNDTLEAWRHS